MSAAPETDPAGPDLAGADKKGKGPPDVQGTGFLPGAPGGDPGGEEGQSAEGTAGTGMGLGHTGMVHNGVRPRARGGHQRSTDWMEHG